MADKITRKGFADIEYGRSIGVENGATINFSRTHSVAPSVVIANNAYSLDRIVSAYNATETGFNVIVETIVGGAATTWVDWIAIWGVLKALISQCFTPSERWGVA